MTRIVVFSDTHRNIKDCIRVLDNLINVDFVIHLGDCVADAVELKRIYKDIPFYFVSGNNDFYSDYEAETVAEISGKKFFCTHGHTCNEESLIKKAKAEGCKMALFGHSHKSSIEEKEGITLLNPGSISRPRDGKKSYGIIEIDGDKILSCIIPVEGLF